MSPAARRAWRVALEALNRRAILLLQRALEREFALVGAEARTIRDARVLATRHANRLVVMLARHDRDVAVRAGAFGLAMLAGRVPREEKADDPSETSPRPAPTPTRDVLVATSAAVVGAALAERAATVLQKAPEAVTAAETMLALTGGDVARAAGKLAADPRFAAAVNEAALGGVVSTARGLSAPPARPPASGSPPSQPPKPPTPPSGPGNPGKRTFGQRVEAHVRYWAPRRARVVAVGSEQIIKKALAESAKLGEGEAKTAKRIAEALGGAVSRWRAARIARTEIGAAQNAAILFTAEGAARKVNKTWAAIDDARTRPHHHEADGQSVPHDQAFIVGAAALMHPGDPTGPVGEVVSCRCTMLIEAA